jgi:hypothetical protein
MKENFAFIGLFPFWSCIFTTGVPACKVRKWSR